MKPAFSDEIFRLIYPGWNDRSAAEADWNAHGEQKWANYMREQDPMTAIMRAAEAKVEEEKKFLSDAFANPFSFDEELARQASQAEFLPHYSELLNDYLTDIETERETIQDEGNLLRTMKKLDTQEKTRSYNRAVRSAQEGFEGAGLFFSGVHKRALGEAEVEQKSDMQKLEAQYGTEEANRLRQLGVLDESEKRKRRDLFGGDVEKGGLSDYLGQQGSYHTAYEGGVEQRRTEQERAYYQPIVSSYRRQFPNSQSGALSGYSIPDYLLYS